MMRRISVLFMAWWVALVPLLANGDAKALLAKGDTLYAKGLFEAAVAEYAKAAELGEPEAQFDLGYAYYNGEGIQRDYTVAVRWFKRAATQDFAKAQYNLSYCYMYGRGVPRDYDKALAFLTKAAGKGCQQAQITLSDCYAKGILVEQNEAESNRWKALAEGTGKVEQEPAAPIAEPATPVAVAAAEPQPEPVEGTVSGAMDGGGTAGMVFDIDLGGDKPLVERPQQPAEAVTAPPKKAEHAPAEVAPKPRPGIVLTRDGIVKPKAEPDSVVAVAADPSVKTPPLVRILFPEDQSLFHTDVVKVKYQLLTYGCPTETKVKVLVDGRAQPDSRAVRQANTVEVDVPNRDCTVMLYAQNAYGNSEPVSIRLVRENVAQVDLPKLFAVVVGVGKYDNEKLPNLRLTCKDAQDFANALVKKKGKPFSDVQVKVLCDEEATRADLFEAMEWMAQEASPNDMCVFFFAGHGYRDERDRFYFMPYHGRIDQLYNCFSANDFKTAADDINSKLVIFVDACYSGGLFSGTRSAAATHFVEQLRRTKNGMMLYASSASDTKSNEDPTWGNGAFTKALVEAFNGAARLPDDEGLSTQQLEMYLYKEVRKVTDFKQSPVFMNPNGMEHFNIFTYEN